MRAASMPIASSEETEVANEAVSKDILARSAGPSSQHLSAMPSPALQMSRSSSSDSVMRAGEKYEAAVKPRLSVGTLPAIVPYNVNETACVARQPSKLDCLCLLRVISLKKASKFQFLLLRALQWPVQAPLVLADRRRSWRQSQTSRPCLYPASLPRPASLDPLLRPEVQVLGQPPFLTLSRNLQTRQISHLRVRKLRRYRFRHSHLSQCERRP
jgi:hypothetical protein